MTPEATPMSPPEQGPGKTTHAAYDDRDKARHKQASTHGRFKAELARSKHATEPRQENAHREVQRPTGGYRFPSPKQF